MGWVGFLILLAGAGLLNTQLDLGNLWVWGLGLVGVAAFVWSIWQVRWSISRLHWVFFAVLILAVWQALVAVIQAHDRFGLFYFWFEYWPFKVNDFGPIGVFQQVNILASFLATALLISFYLLVTPRFKDYARLLKIALWLVVVLLSYVLFISGSRAGFLAMLIGIPLLHYARWYWVGRARSFVFLWWLALLFGIGLAWWFPGERSFAALASKFEQVASGQDIRWFLYNQSWLTFLQAPWFGHGLGNFNSAFLATSEMFPPPAHLADLKLANFSHPHNELLYWMVQSGWIALAGTLLLAGYFLWALFSHFSKSYALTLLALSSPLWLHSLLCYPFSLSAVHLFLLLFFVALGVRGRSRTYSWSLFEGMRTVWKVYLLRFLTGLVSFGLAGLVVLALYGSWHTLKSIQDMFYFENVFYEVGKQTPEEIENTLYFRYATHNWAYRSAVEVMMDRMLDKALQSGNEYDIVQYQKWVARSAEPTEQMLRNLERINER
jgi:O-antigen polymerase